MLGLRWIAVVAVGFSGCAAPFAPSNYEVGTTGAAETGTSASGTEGPSSTTGNAESSDDGSHETDYPVEPGCEEGDDGYGEYPPREDTPPGGGVDSTAGMGGDIPIPSVFQVRRGEFEGGTRLRLNAVVVTTPAIPGPDSEEDWVFVQEAAGGPLSGILLRFPFGAPSELIPGDELTVTGDYVERYSFASIEVTDFDVAVFPSGFFPEPVLVTPGMISAGGELAESLESVLVEVQQLEVIDPVVCPGEVLVQATLKLDDRYLAAEGEALPAPPTGIYSSVRGPLIYTYNGFEVAPRSLEDITF